jgi:DNA-binding CsgD family transcriptional regulator
MKRELFGEGKDLEIIRLCHSALDSRSLRGELLQSLRKIIPFDYAYFSTTDPASHLATSSVLIEEPPSWCMAVFLENEFLQDDFNKFSDLLRNHQTVGILSDLTGNELHRSQRYHQMLTPMGMEDELRAVFVTDEACWGTLCLHREKSKSKFSPAEAAYLAQLSPHIADGLRKALLLSDTSSAKVPDGPGVLILNEDLSIVAMTHPAEYWMLELAEMEKAAKDTLPVTVRSVVMRLKAIETGQISVDAMPKLRLQLRSGHWLVLYASRLKSSETQPLMTVIFEMAQPAEIAPLIMQAYNLTRREGEVTQCVLRGCSTNEIAMQLYISQNTVQDHLKAIFEKVSVSSRGELAARIFRQQHG